MLGWVCGGRLQLARANDHNWTRIEEAECTPEIGRGEAVEGFETKNNTTKTETLHDCEPKKINKQGVTDG